MNIIVDLCIIPIGKGTSLSSYIAECGDIIEKSGLSYQLGPNGTAIEGEWDDVFNVIKKCHDKLHNIGVNRIHTSVKIGSRIDRSQTIEDKISSIRSLRERND